MIIAVCSWALTLAFVLFALRAHLRLVLVARACHELRGPLFAVQLGLHGLVGDPARMAAIELELARAGRAHPVRAEVEVVAAGHAADQFEAGGQRPERRAVPGPRALLHGQPPVERVALVLMNFAWNGLGGLVSGRSWTPPAAPEA